MNLKTFILNEDKSIKKTIVLSSKPEKSGSYRTAEKLIDEGKKLGLMTYLVYSEDAFIRRENARLFIHNIDDKKGFEINPNDTIVFTRGSVGRFLSSMDLLSQLEKSKFFMVNDRECIEVCGDKYRTTMKLAEMSLPTPKTHLVRNEQGLVKAHKNLGGKFPVVLKTLQGSKGVGVFIAKDFTTLLSTLQTIWKLNPETELIMQEFIPCDGDLRIHVLGDKAVACMKRIRKTEDFRTNYSLGNDVKGMNLDTLGNEIKDIAIKASKAVGAIWSGVDVIIGSKDKKPYIIEVNASPGTDGIEKATKTSIIKPVFKYVMDRSKWSRPTIECGWKEYVWIENLGYVRAKFDTGNGNYIAVHADEWEIAGDTVIWKINNKKFKNKLLAEKTIRVGGLRDHTEKRPLISLTIKFNGETYENIEVLLANRSKRAPVLINRQFIKTANLSINPAKKYILSLKAPKSDDKKEIA